MINRLAFLLSVAVCVTASADNWPQWRGPTQNGVAAEGDYPTKWSADSNIAWKVDLPSRGGATPIVFGDQIFVTATNDDDKNVVMAISKAGEVLWETPFGTKRAGKHKKASGANPSPCTDGKHLFAYFKSGDLAALDMKGNVVWQTNIQKEYGEDTLWWDLGTSPVLTSKHVIVTVMHSGPSFLVAFDKSTGQVAWKQQRNLGAPEEAAQSYTTPIIAEHNGQELLIIAGADHVTAHNASTGEELWRVGGLNPTQHKYYRSISSPVVSDGLVFAPYARGGTVTAIKLGGEGDVTDTHVKYTYDDHGSDVPTPTVGDGVLYLLGDKGDLTCVDIEKGKTLWSERIEKHRTGFSASPTLAGDLLYALREDGTCFVIRVNRDGYKIVSKNELDNMAVATPVLVDGSVYIRTFDQLWCIR